MYELPLYFILRNGVKLINGTHGLFHVFIKRRNGFSITFSWTTQPLFAFLLKFITILYCQSIISPHSISNIYIIWYKYSNILLNSEPALVVGMLNKTVFCNIGSFALSYICSRQWLIVDNHMFENTMKTDNIYISQETGYNLKKKT